MGQRWSPFRLVTFWVGVCHAIVLLISFAITPDAIAAGAVCLWPKSLEHHCMFCGLTRSFCAISHGEIDAGISFHRLGPAIYVIFAVLAINSILQAIALLFHAASSRRLRATNA